MSSAPVQAVAAPVRTSGGGGSSVHPAGRPSKALAGAGPTVGSWTGTTPGAKVRHAKAAPAAKTANATSAAANLL